MENLFFYAFRTNLVTKKHGKIRNPGPPPYLRNFPKFYQLFLVLPICARWRPALIYVLNRWCIFHKHGDPDDIDSDGKKCSHDSVGHLRILSS